MPTMSPSLPAFIARGSEDVRTGATISSSPTTIDLRCCEPKATRSVSHSTGDNSVRQRFRHVLSRGEEMSYIGSRAEECNKRNRDRSCTAKVIGVASWSRTSLSCCDAETVPTSLSSAFATSLEMKQFWLIKWCPIGVNLVSIDRGHIGINYDRRDRKVNGSSGVAC
ncbi:hypothetical protein F2Q69_00032264 [Brassica cretica]|uniref:Uncharacterized protein n=1 Tax=Brassica cretica TaxID=69181 RepID=A0A8S9S1X0_BRACR|nr:hypothetical protein F2Q69_00032264 [Brassica cretica]